MHTSNAAPQKMSDTSASRGAGHSAPVVAERGTGMRPGLLKNASPTEH